MIADIPALIEQIGGADRVAILHDARVEKIAREVSASLKNAPIIAVDSGESSKTQREKG